MEASTKLIKVDPVPIAAKTEIAFRFRKKVYS